jgi:hypothetical protein
LTVLLSTGFVLLFTAAPSLCWSQAEPVRVAYWYPKYWVDLDSCGCTYAGMIGTLEDRQGNLNYQTVGDHDAAYDDTNVTLFSELLNFATNSQVLLVKAHGLAGTVPNGGFQVSSFMGRLVGQAELSDLQSQYGCMSFVGWDNNYTFNIYITPYGIGQLLGPLLHDDELVGGFYCRSRAGYNSWGLQPSAALVGYTNDANCGVNCTNLATFIDRMTCGSGAQGFNDMVAPAVRELPGLGYDGSGANRINPNRSCASWSSSLLACARRDSLRWVALDGCPADDYVARWFNSPTSEPETVAVVQGIGDGPGSWCGYGVPCQRTAGFGEIMERKNGTFFKASEPFGLGVEPQSWVEVQPGMCLEVPQDSVSAVPDSVLEQTPSGFVWHVIGSDPPREDPERYCADVVAYTTTSDPLWMTRVRAHVDNYVTGQGNALKLRWFVGTGNPLTARGVYRDVVAANEAWNDGGHQRQYPPRPLLMLIGDGVSGIHVADPLGICAHGYCTSLTLITDLDEDGRPDGLTTQIPAATYQELGRACDAADDWNQGHFVDTQGSFAVFLGDRYSMTAADPDWEDDAWQCLSRTYQWSGHPLRCFLRESSYGPLDIPIMAAAGRTCLDEGVRDLWVQGVRTNSNCLTSFLVPSLYSATRKQRIMLFAPTCSSGAADLPPILVRVLMFADPEGTEAAGAIGCRDLGYAPQHALFRDLLLTELAVFDVAGRRVALVDQGPRSGRQQVQWSSKGVSSGVYFARLVARRSGEELRRVAKVVIVE